jgi:hypothetical protein
VNCYGSHLGAIIQGYDSGSSESGRVYGMTTTGTTAIATTVNAGATNFLGHNATSNNTHAGVFAVSGGIANREFQLVAKSLTTTFAGTSFPGQLITTEQSIIGIPIPVYATANDRAVGVYRQLLAFQDDYAYPFGLIMSGTNSLNARTVGVYMTFGSTSTTTDALLFLSTGSF